MARAAHSTGGHCASTSTCATWRYVNGMIAAVYAFVSARLYLTEPDWWMWTPMYVLLVATTLPLAVCAKSSACSYWRYACASTIVVGLAYSVACAWALNDARHVFQLYTQVFVVVT